MSYNSANQSFVNKAFAVTTLNYNGATGLTTPNASLQPQSHQDIPLIFGIHYEIPVNITTQNSFTFLQAALGARPSDGYAHWSDPGTVDSSATNYVAPPTVGPGSVVHGTLNLIDGNAWGGGNYDAFKMTAGKTEQVHLTLAANGFSGLTPALQVRDANGNQLFFNQAGRSSGTARIDFQATAGQTYSFVVGGENGWNFVAATNFTLAVTATDPVPNLTGSTFALTFDNLSGLKSKLVIQSEDINSGFFSGVFTSVTGYVINVVGTVSNTTHDAKGVATSDINFSGYYYFAGKVFQPVSFFGKLAGSGAGSHDTLSGNLLDMIGGPVHGQDF